VYARADGDISLCFYFYKDRVEVGGVYPKFDGHVVTPRDVWDGNVRLQAPKSISISTSRGPETIAKEIRRRLWPEYTRTLERVRAKIREMHDYENATRCALEQVAAGTGSTVSGNAESRSVRTGGLVFRVGGRDLVRLEGPVYMSPDAAVEIARILAEDKEA
jgi:hypothetical protein